MSPEAEVPDDLQIEEHPGFLEARFLGVFKAVRFNRQVDDAVNACLKRNLTRLLIDASQLQSKISAVDRFEIGAHGARAASRLEKVAVLGPRGIMDPNKFAAKVAQNRGLTTDTFNDRQKAVDWLLAPS